jgi:hypothetical protein
VFTTQQNKKKTAQGHEKIYWACRQDGLNIWVQHKLHFHSWSNY